jgi:hypothetical protein
MGFPFFKNLDKINIDKKSIDEFKNIAKDEYNTDPRMLGALGKIYQTVVAARYA